jgi:hypothetical protein
MVCQLQKFPLDWIPYYALLTVWYYTFPGLELVMAAELVFIKLIVLGVSCAARKLCRTGCKRIIAFVVIVATVFVLYSCVIFF